MFTSAMVGPDEAIRYLESGGAVTVYRGGSRAWRTHNPGEVGHGLLAVQHGAIGRFGGLAIFASRDKGHQCLLALLGDRRFAYLTVTEAYRRFDPAYEPNRPEASDPNAAPPPPECPHTGIQADRPMADLSDGERQQMADTIENELIDWTEGETEEEELEESESEQAQAGAQGDNVLINGRSAVHAGSGGKLTTPDVCKTPSGDGCTTVMYSNRAASADADGTASSVKINGDPACIESSTFSKSSGDEGGRCGGIRSGTTRGEASFLQGSGNVTIEGEAAVRQFELMVSNSENTPPMPLMQSGGPIPPEVEAEVAEAGEATGRGQGLDIEIAGSEATIDTLLVSGRRES